LRSAEFRQRLMMSLLGAMTELMTLLGAGRDFAFHAGWL
jgi:hypothetical protein